MSNTDSPSHPVFANRTIDLLQLRLTINNLRPLTTLLFAHSDPSSTPSIPLTTVQLYRHACLCRDSLCDDCIPRNPCAWSSTPWCYVVRTLMSTYCLPSPHFGLFAGRLSSTVAFLKERRTSSQRHPIDTAPKPMVSRGVSTTSKSKCQGACSSSSFFVGTARRRPQRASFHEARELVLAELLARALEETRDLYIRDVELQERGDNEQVTLYARSLSVRALGPLLNGPITDYTYRCLEQRKEEDQGSPGRDERS